MYTYADASRLAHLAQDVVNEAVGLVGDSTEVYTALHDSGYLMGLMRGGAPVEDHSFQMACSHLDHFVRIYTEA